MSIDKSYDNDLAVAKAMTAPLDEKGLEAAMQAMCDPSHIAGGIDVTLPVAIRAYLAASPSPSMEMEVVADDGAPWVLLKRGLFWRPGGQGYTGIKAEAGRYSDDYAIGYSLHDEGGTTRMLWSEAPELAPSCPEETAIKHYRSQVLRLTEENEALRGLVERLKLEARGHASEARTANSTIYEIYQALSGSKGEPGNWNGAEPARQYVEAAEARIKALEEEAGRAAVVIQPFADAADSLEDSMPGRAEIWETPAAMAIEAVDLRMAKQFIDARSALKENAL